jgi:hypothetical protein
VIAASIIRAMSKLIPVYTAQQPRRQPSSEEKGVDADMRRALYEVYRRMENGW